MANDLDDLFNQHIQIQGGTAMEQSPDLKDVMLRYYEAVAQGDVAFMDRILSSQREVLIIGTDPNEWLADPATINQTLKAQAQAGIKIVPGDLLAYREGSRLGRGSRKIRLARRRGGTCSLDSRLPSRRRR